VLFLPIKIDLLLLGTIFDHFFGCEEGPRGRLCFNISSYYLILLLRKKWKHSTILLFSLLFSFGGGGGITETSSFVPGVTKKYCDILSLSGIPQYGRQLVGSPFPSPSRIPIRVMGCCF